MAGNRIRKYYQLVTLVLLALLLGLGNPFFDFPLAFSVGDEFESQRVAFQILGSRSLVQNSVYFPLWSWLQIPFIGISLVFLLVTKMYPNLEAIQKALVLSSPGMMLFIPRILSAVFSAGSLIWLWKLGEKMVSKRYALLITLVFTFDFMRVQLAHFGRHSSPFLFFSLGFGYFLYRFVTEKKTVFAKLSLIFILLATATYQLGLLYFVPFIAAFMVNRRLLKVFKDRSIVVTAVVTLCSIGGLFYLNPAVISDSLGQLKPIADSDTLRTNFTYFEKLRFYFAVLLSYQGIVALVSPLGLYLLFKYHKQKPALLLLLSAFGIQFLPYVIKTSSEPRYLLTLCLITILSAGYILEKYRNKLSKVVTVGIFAYSVAVGLRFNALFAYPSTYLQAKEWVETTVPSDVPLLVHGNNFYLIPKLESQQPPQLYELDYYKTINPYLITLSPEERQKLPNIKHVRPANNLQYFSGKNDFEDVFLASNYTYVILDYFTLREKQSLIEKFQLNVQEFELVAWFYPKREEGDVDTVLNIADPRHLFAWERYGPNYEIYRKKIQN